MSTLRHRVGADPVLAIKLIFLARTVDNTLELAAVM
jgi:hypothetical protein